MHLKTYDCLRSWSPSAHMVARFNAARYRTLQVTLQRPKRLDGVAKVVACGLRVLEVEDIVERECSICADRFEREGEGCNHDPVMTACRHVFGHDCIVRWLSDHETCPMCRYRLV